MTNRLLEKAKRLFSLHNVKLNEVSIVKNPAAPDARIAFYKRHEEGTDSMTDTAMQKEVRAIVAEEIGKALGGADVRKAVGEALAESLGELRKTTVEQPIKKAVDTMTELADEIRKAADPDHPLSPAQAMARVIKQRPELYAQHRAETARRRGDPRF